MHADRKGAGRQSKLKYTSDSERLGLLTCRESRA